MEWGLCEAGQRELRALRFTALVLFDGVWHRVLFTFDHPIGRVLTRGIDRLRVAGKGTMDAKRLKRVIYGGHLPLPLRSLHNGFRVIKCKICKGRKIIRSAVR